MSTSTDAPGLCDQCIKGVRHEGEPRGKIEVINGIETYVTLPEGEYDKTKAVLYLTGEYFTIDELLFILNVN